MIKGQNLFHHFGFRTVLDGISFDIETGELVAIMGSNGVGKSTVLTTIAGVLQPLEGSVSIDGVARHASLKEELTLRRRTVYLPDQPWLPLTLTGREYVTGVAELYRVAPRRIIEHCARLFRLFELEEKADSPVRTYSNGQKKKIAIAATLATDAEILVLDEPFTGGLDPSAIHALKEVLRRCAEDENTTVVIASQIPEIVEAIAHRVLILQDAATILAGTPAELCDLVGVDSLAGALSSVMNPETESNLDNYFAG